MEELFIPKLGQTVEEVKLIAWLVEEGAKVEFGVPVLEVETDKAVFPVEANAAGYVHKGPFQAGETLPVLTVVATIGKADEKFKPAGSAVPPAGERESAGAGQTQSPVQAAGARETSGHLFASPRARKAAAEKRVDLNRVPPSGDEGRRIVEKDVLAYASQLPKTTPVAAHMATEMGLDLTGVAGTGPKGAVTKADVEKLLQTQPTAGSAAAAPAPSGGEVSASAPGPLEVTHSVPLAGVRGIIFERMGASVHTTARVTLVTEADATDFVAARERLKESVGDTWGFTPGYNDLLGLIVAKALREFPYMNARVSADGQAVEWLAQVNLGLAVDTDRGLLVTVIRDADRKRLREFGQEFRTLVDRARAGRSLPDDLTGGTFTITNLGMYDVDAFTPVINLPEAAILGVGRIQGKVVPHKKKIKVRQMLTLSLVFDHRLNDGAPAARFLQRIKQLIETPWMLLE